VVKSLVLSEQVAGQPAHFSMLETIRAFAHEKLAAAGETELAHKRHLGYLLALAEQAEPALRGPRQHDWLKQLDDEHDNLRAALAWAIQREEAEGAQRLAGALGYFWLIRGYSAEGFRWLNEALRLPAGPGARCCRETPLAGSNCTPHLIGPI
jgi:predicted ATPase